MPAKTPPLVNAQVAEAMAHDTRIHALTWLMEEDMTPAAIAERLGLSVGNVMHHIRVLKKLDCIELVEVQPVRGGRVSQQIYRGKVKPYVDDEAWEKLSPTGKRRLVILLLRLVSGDVNQAMLHGTMFDPDDNHLSRSPLNLDLEGWEETKLLLQEAVDGLTRIQEKVDERATAGEVFPVKVEILQFRSPDLDPSPGL